MARTKDTVSWSIDIQVLKRLRELKKQMYPGLSESAVAEILIRDALPLTSISVAD